MRKRQNKNQPSSLLVTRGTSPDAILPFYGDKPAKSPLWALSGTIILAALALYLLLNSSQFLQQTQSRIFTASADNSKFRFYSQKLDSMQDKMSAYLADSVETRLKALERNVSNGAIGIQEIKTFEELKSQLKLLESYSVGKNGNVTDPIRMDHPRFQMTPGPVASDLSDELVSEVLKIRNLCYFSIASCGLMAILLGRHWWQATNNRAKQLPFDAHRRPLLTSNSQPDSGK